MLRSFILISALVVALLVGIGVVAGQVLPERVAPRVISGSDLGFRVEGIRGGKVPVGTLVVRINGEWVEADTLTAFEVRPGTK
jgi:hypothetical protein